GCENETRHHRRGTARRRLLRGKRRTDPERSPLRALPILPILPIPPIQPLPSFLPLLPSMTLENKVALITGGKRIGAVVARELAARGVHAGLSYARSKAEAEEAAAVVRAAGRRAEVFAANLAEPTAAAALVQSVVETFGRLDILVNMASVYAQKP